ncbi:response regulator transcription factor [Oscillochloris sp. ZM17-4]|uniref:response regulator n=1 Tax=Oscillochloris sp. ZM17-4 TaxID=2866714 RepID=UPI001C72D94C|nr:response regulator transcription factor [Oscillochloris sp. ZM17-4]MBX0328334.1 response regulator transcription factor [Oscillochloris sp. ZM17-4]
MAALRVVLADDHELVRAGISALLQRIPDLSVVAEAANGHEALRLIAQHRPDLVLLDITMPELNGLEVADQVARDFPATRVIILSMHATSDYVLKAMRVGASGYLLKGARLAELDLAISAVMRGETYLSPAAAKHVVGGYRDQAGRADSAESPEQLTPRQREILQMIAEGKTTKEIAQILTLSAKTVEMHRAQLMERLDIHDVAGLVRYALRTGVISDER